jgi:hypothetical protein
MKGPTLTQAKNKDEESTMISKTCCIARMIVLASSKLERSQRKLVGEISRLHSFDPGGVADSAAVRPTLGQRRCGPPEKRENVTSGLPVIRKNAEVRPNNVSRCVVLN